MPPYRLFWDLIKNAMEAIEESDVAQPLILIRAHVDGRNLLLLDVIDNGIGIRPESLQWIFSPGYTTKPRGSGLGLHSAANYVIGTGGSIRPLSDGIGHGTTMRVQLKLTAQRQPQGAEQA